MARIPIKHTKKVPALTEDAYTIVIPNDVTWRISKFMSDCIGGGDAVVYLAWDYDGYNEEILFSSHGPSTLPYEIEKTGDGYAELAVVLNNQTPDEEIMMGIVEIKEL